MQYSSQIIESFKVESVDPIGNVKPTITSHRKEVQGRKHLHLPGLLNHPHLWHHGYRLQVDREGPGDLHEGKFMIDNHRETEAD